MPMQRIVLGIFLAALTIGPGATRPASAEEYRGTWEQQMACTPDVMRLCSDRIPDVTRIVACLRENTASLGNSCRAVFESSASADQPPPARAVPAPRSRAAQPFAPAPRSSYQDRPAYQADE